MSREAFEKYKAATIRMLMEAKEPIAANGFARDVNPETFKAGWKACEAQAPVVAEVKAENERLKQIIDLGFDALDDYESTAGGSPEAYNKFIRSRKKFMVFVKALKESKS